MALATTYRCSQCYPGDDSSNRLDLTQQANNLEKPSDLQVRVEKKDIVTEIYMLDDAGEGQGFVVAEHGLTGIPAHPGQRRRGLVPDISEHQFGAWHGFGRMSGRRIEDFVNPGFWEIIAPLRRI